MSSPLRGAELTLQWGDDGDGSQGLILSPFDGWHPKSL